jgi:hypothetical protein
LKKSKAISILIGTIVIGGLAVMGYFGWGSFTSYREIDQEKSFVADQTDSIKLDMSSIPVHIIQTEAGNDIRIHLYGKTKRGLELISETVDQAVIVQVDHKLDGLPIEDVVLDVFIPENYEKDLIIKTTSGLVRVDPIHLSEFSLNTSSGGLEAEKLTAGKITLNTTSGNIDIHEFDSGELKIKGSSSDVTITCSDFNQQRIEILTTSGSIDLTLPGFAEFSYRIATNGKFQSDFPISAPDKISKTNLEGQIGNGMNRVSLQASSGKITISEP